MEAIKKYAKLKIRQSEEVSSSRSRCKHRPFTLEPTGGEKGLGLQSQSAGMSRKESKDGKCGIQKGRKAKRNESESRLSTHLASSLSRRPSIKNN
jgi:hypothetical protein